VREVRPERVSVGCHFLSDASFDVDIWPFLWRLDSMICLIFNNPTMTTIIDAKRGTPMPMATFFDNDELE
jgi:hypothetical protein